MHTEVPISAAKVVSSTRRAGVRPSSMPSAGHVRIAPSFPLCLFAAARLGCCSPFLWLRQKGQKCSENVKISASSATSKPARHGCSRRTPRVLTKLFGAALLKLFMASALVCSSSSSSVVSPVPCRGKKMNCLRAASAQIPVRLPWLVRVRATHLEDRLALDHALLLDVKVAVHHSSHLGPPVLLLRQVWS